MNTETLMNRLFKWRTSVVIDGITFYVRVVGDQVIDDARKEALLESRKLRRALRDQESDDYLIYLDALQDLDDESLRNLVIVVAMRTIMREYLNTNPRPVLLPLGDNPTQEEQEQFEESKEAREQEYLAAMELYVEQWREDFTKTLEKRDTAYLLGMAKVNRIDQVCEEKFSNVFEEYVIAASLYSDDKYTKRMLTVPEYRELPSEIKSQLRDAYNNMSIGPDDIKN